MRKLTSIMIVLCLVGAAGVSHAQAPAAPATDPGERQAELDRLKQVIEQQERELKARKRTINALEEELALARRGQGGEVEDPNVGRADAKPWTEYQQRLPYGALFPRAGSLRGGEVFARFSHIGQENLFTDETNAFHELLGIESNVKVGLMFGYGLTNRWDVLLQRTNGRDGVPVNDRGDTITYDAWDALTKVRLLDENENGIDLSLFGGATYLWQTNDAGVWAGNGGLLMERGFGRLRLGTGVLYTSLSTFEAALTMQEGGTPTKRHPDEVRLAPEFQSYGANHTVAIPVTASLALTSNIELFGESAFAVHGYETKGGPSAAGGLRISSHTHAYTLFLCNTPNNSYNSTFSGGYRQDHFDLFGFTIAIFF